MGLSLEVFVRLSLLHWCPRLKLVHRSTRLMVLVFEASLRLRGSGVLCTQGQVPYSTTGFRVAWAVLPSS